MKKVISVLGVAGLLLGLTAQINMQPVRTTTVLQKKCVASQENDSVQNTQETATVSSAIFWEYNGEVYTVDNVIKNGYHSISGQYKDTMAVYQDKIYWRKTNASSEMSSEIISMDMNGENQTVLTKSARPNAKFCIYDNYLYYTSGDGKINLNYS